MKKKGFPKSWKCIHIPGLEEYEQGFNTGWNLALRYALKCIRQERKAIKITNKQIGPPPGDAAEKVILPSLKRLIELEVIPGQPERKEPKNFKVAREVRTLERKVARLSKNRK